MEPVLVVNRYALTGGSAGFVLAADALARRVQDEGHPGIRHYHFFCPPGAGEGRLVAVYDGPEAWVGHHDIAMGWPELAALRAAADLVEIALHGPLSDAMREWLDRAGLMPRVRHHGVAVAGFQRPSR